MGQCGCNDIPVESAYKLPSGEVVGYAVYHGCSECFSGPAVDIFIYPNAKSEWIRDAKVENFKPDEYGGNHGRGIPIAFFEVRDLIEAAKAIGGTAFTDTKNGYDSVEDWLNDYGLDMMQAAMHKFAERVPGYQGDGEVMSDNDLLLRIFRVALQRLAAEPDGYCHCEHDDENCCEEMDTYCPICIAGKALAMETRKP